MSSFLIQDVSQLVSAGQRRFLSIHEHQSMTLLNAVRITQAALAIEVTLASKVRDSYTQERCSKISTGIF